jgi:hypothetical protein
MTHTTQQRLIKSLWSDDLVMLHKILGSLSLSVMLVTAFSQSSDPSKSSRLDNEKPTIYIKVECQNKATVRLRLYNNTYWAVTIPTFSLYVNPKKVATIKLVNGETAFALPNDRDISSIYYYVEKDGAQENIDVPRLNYADSFNPSWIPSNDSIFFTVPKDHLREGLKVYVPFNYEWEINKQGIIHNEPQHKVFFRGAALLNLDELVTCQQ